MGRQTCTEVGESLLYIHTGPNQRVLAGSAGTIGACETAFSTTLGHWHCWVLPIGLHGAPATFQWLMDIILRPHQAIAAAYLDDEITL